MGGYIGSRSVVLSTTAANVQDVTATDTTPEVTIVNSTHEDTDGGREGKVIFKGQQSGGEESTLAEIQGSHDGTSDDEKGDLIFRTNDGSDGASPTEAMRIDSAQNLGLGTNSPDVRLHVTDSQEQLTLSEGGSKGATFDYRSSTGNLNIATNGIDARANPQMTLDLNGNVGLGTSAPACNFHIKGDNPRLRVEGDDNTVKFDVFMGDSNPVVGTSTNHDLVIMTNDAERMRIDNSGSVMINKTSTAQTSDAGHAFIDDGRYFSIAGFSNNSQETLSVYSTGVSSFRFYVDYGGTIHATSTSISAISDQRLKENITDLDTGLDEVLALQPRRFDWINGDGENVAGFIAQEVETVLPDLIDNFKHTELSDAKGLKMGDMIPTLVKAIQEQQATITAQATKIDALETQNTTQATQIADLITRVTTLEAE
jgi:hypothetical protein